MTRAVLACVGVGLLAALFAFKVSAKMPDFEVYWRSAIRAAAAEPLYRPQDGHYQFKYLPAAAVFAIPIGTLSLPVAKAIWFGVSCGLLAALVALSIVLLPARRRPVWYLALAGTVAMAKFFGHELVLGQANALLATLAVAGVYLLRRQRDIVSGALVALAVVVKPYALILVPWLGARPRAGAASAAGLAAALILPAALYGFDGNVAQHRAWWTTVTDSTAPNLLNPDNVSLAAMYAKWLGPGSAAASLAVATALALLAAAVLVFVRRRDLPFPEALEAALLLTLMPLLSPQGWDYVFLVSTPAIVLLANYEDLLPRPMRVLAIAAVATIAFSLFDVMGRRAYAAFMSLSAISVCFLVVIAALCTLRLRRAA